jgi:hypothetical protein
MTNRQPLTIVIRIPNVVLSWSDLNASLALAVDRYEASSDHAPGYAQIDIADDRDQWAAALDCVQSIRASVLRLVSEGLIGAPTLDVAIGFPCSSLSKSLTIPAGLAAVAGETGMDVHLSVYQTEQ